MSQKTIHLLMMTPEKIIFDDKVLIVSCQNELGKLDILPEHSNFMSMIDKEIIIRDLSDKEKKIPIEQAILQVLRDKVLILVNTDISQNDQVNNAKTQKSQG